MPVPENLPNNDKVLRLELAMKKDIVEEDSRLRADVRFVPYLQLHEYEGLLFSDPAALAGCFRWRCSQDRAAAPEEARGGMTVMAARRHGLPLWAGQLHMAQRGDVGSSRTLTLSLSRERERGRKSHVSGRPLLSDRRKAGSGFDAQLQPPASPRPLGGEGQGEGARAYTDTSLGSPYDGARAWVRICHCLP